MNIAFYCISLEFFFLARWSKSFVIIGDIIAFVEKEKVSVTKAVFSTSPELNWHLNMHQTRLFHLKSAEIASLKMINVVTFDGSFLP